MGCRRPHRMAMGKELRGAEQIRPLAHPTGTRRRWHLRVGTGDVGRDGSTAYRKPRTDHYFAQTGV